MKNIYTIVFLLFLSLSYSQTTKEERQKKKELKKEKIKLGLIDCSDLIVEHKELQGTTSYGIRSGLKITQIILIKTEKPEGNIIELCFVGKTPICNEDFKGIYFKLENGDILRYPDASLICLGTSIGSITQGRVLLDEDLYSKLKDSDIIQFSLGSFNFDVNYKPTHFKTLVDCAYNDK